MTKFYLLFVLTFSTLLLFGHSGGTDSEGGHHDRKRGGYHYHHGYGPHEHTLVPHAGNSG